MLNHSKIALKAINSACDYQLKYLIEDPNSDMFGTSIYIFVDTQYAADQIIAAAMNYVMGYYFKGSKYYHNKMMLEKSLAFVKFFDERYVHEDGSIDLQSTNFHCPNTTGFGITTYFARVLYIIEKHTSHTKEEDELFDTMIATLRKMNEAIKHLGFHTPNHRWAITGALCACYKFLGDEESLEVMNRFLSEGIDCSDQGEWTERSTGCYNLICDREYLFLYFQTGDKKFLDPVVRNLKLMFSLTEADDSVCTMSSTRIDNGTYHTIEEYYQFYYAAAIYSKDPELAWYADHLMKKLDAMEVANVPPRCDRSFVVFLTMMDPEINKIEKEIKTKKPDLHKSVLLKSGMARYYYGKNKSDCLTLVQSPYQNFLNFHFSKTAEVKCRFAGAFFGDEHSIFRADSLTQREDGAFVMTAHDTAGYKSLFDTPPETSDWWKMDHSKRKVVNERHFNRTVVITPIKNGFAIDYETEGDVDIPLKFEFVMSPGGMYKNKSNMVYADKGAYVIQLDGPGEVYHPGWPIVTIKGNGIEKSLGRHMRGSGPYAKDSFTVAILSTSNAKEHYEFTYKPFFD